MGNRPGVGVLSDAVVVCAHCYRRFLNRLLPYLALRLVVMCFIIELGFVGF